MRFRWPHFLVAALVASLMHAALMYVLARRMTANLDIADDDPMSAY